MTSRIDGMALVCAGLGFACACAMPPASTATISSRLRLGRSECGDGIWEYPLEYCEDGNAESGDGCDTDCHVEYGWDCGAGSSVTAWGDNYFGQAVSQPGPFVAVSAGAHHTIALRPDGSVVGWGRNLDGQSEAQAGPFIAIDTGQLHSIGLRPNGSVVGWGSNISGQVEPNHGPFIAISCGREFNLGLYADGSAVGWGDNDQGQANFHAGPFVAIAAGGYHSLGLRADGSVEGWGENQWGEADSKPGPYIAISAGDHHSIGLRADGSVDAWGDNKFNQGVGKAGPFIAIDAGGFHNLGLKADGSVSGWGFNYYGQTVRAPGPFSVFAAGGFHSVAIGTTTCAVLCGDGVIIGAEECDDMNAESGDGCSSSCAVEDRWVCEFPARPCACAWIYVGAACDRCPDGYWGFPDCQPCGCDDGDACNGLEFCDPETGCRPGIAPICDDGRECSFDNCDPVAGCRYDLSLCRCSSDGDCDDSDACSGVETCDMGRGLCLNGQPLVCGDGDVCNGVESCDPASGCVQGVSLDCDDGRVCTADTCDPVFGCRSDNSGCGCNRDLDCDDLSVCTGTDWCDISAGVCLSGTPRFCMDDRACTVDSCDPVAGCVYDASGCGCSGDLDCDDLSICTGVETCQISLGTCQQGAPPVCDDNRSCSMDSCDIQKGCMYDLTQCRCAVDQDCDDHSVCSGIESCDVDAGKCVDGAALNCRDGRACTRDMCDPVFGCVHDASNCVCEVDSDCRAPWERCVASENRCAVISCAPCGGTAGLECGPSENRCHAFESGAYCVTDCSAGDFNCPSGYVCSDVDGGRFCMPVSGDCACTPDVAVECRGAVLWWMDSCGQPVRVERDCESAGCLDGSCCPEGFHSDGAKCVESVDESPELSGGDAREDAASRDDTSGRDVDSDGIDSAQGDIVGPADGGGDGGEDSVTGGGCDAGVGGGESRLIPVALLMMVAAAFVRRRRVV